MSSAEWTPTDTQVRDGFRYDPEAEYRDPITPHHEINGRAFDRWLAKHDAEVAAKTLREVADDPALRISGAFGISITRLIDRANEIEVTR